MRTRKTVRAKSDREAPVIGTFGVSWAAAIVVWRESLDDGYQRLGYAVGRIPRLGSVSAASFEVDGGRVCFRIVVDRRTKTVAQTVASRAIREALSEAGVGVGPLATWSLLQLDLDTTPLAVKPAGVDRLALRQS